MLQLDKHLWTSRFLLIAGLVLAGQIILGIIIYALSGFSSALTQLAMTAFLLLGGMVVLDWLGEPSPRKIVLSAGFFVLIALFFLMPLSGGQTNEASRQPAGLLLQMLFPVTSVLALLAFLGRAISRKTVVAGQSPRGNIFGFEQSDYPQAYWFARLAHLALAGIAGIELLWQLASGPRLLLLPFNNRLYDGFSLNSLVVLLLGILLISSLLRVRKPLAAFDGWLILIFALICSLFQYTFGDGELARIGPALGQPQIVGINLVLSVVPLALAIFALFSEWGRFFTPFWLTAQLLVLQPSLRSIATRAGASSGSGVLMEQALLYILAIVLIVLAVRLFYYWDRRSLNVVDVITVILIVLVAGLTMWSVGQSEFQRAQPLLNTPQGANLLAVSESLIALAYVAGFFLVFSIGWSVAALFFRYRFTWLERTANVFHFLLVLSITIGALLLLNTVGSQSAYLVADTLNPHRWSTSLPTLPVRNQYVLDGLFALVLLSYIVALAGQRLDRSFAHTERLLIFLSGGVCWLILASSGRQAVLPLVSANTQQIGAILQPAFTTERIVALCILLASLISLLWLVRSRNRFERFLLLTVFGVAALCACIDYFFALPVLLLISLVLLMAGTLISARIEYVQTHPEPEPPPPTEQENGEPATNSSS